MTASNLIGLAKTGLFLAGQKAPVNEVRFPAYEAKNPAIDSYLYVKDSALRKTFDEFMTGKGSSNPRRVDETTQGRARRRRRPSRRRKRNKPSSIKGLEQAPHRGREHGRARREPGQARLPVLLPGAAQDRLALRRHQAAHLRASATRQDKLHQAYRLVLYAGALRRVLRRPGDGLEVPADPRRPGPHARPSNGRKLMLYYDGSHLRLVAWRTREGRLLGHEHADDVDPELAA